MFLDFSQDNIEILTLTSNINTNKFPENYTLWDFFTLIPAKEINKYTYAFSWYCEIRKSKGIYLGTNDEIANLLNSKKDDNMNYKNVFIEPLANVPREYLKDNNIIRKRSIDNSEVAIVPNYSFKKLWEPYLHKTLILFNSKTNKYLVISDLHNDLWSKEIKDKFKKHFVSFNNIVDDLFKYNLISKDYQMLYSGEVLNITNDKECSFMSNLNKYNNIIFEKDYNDYLNNKKDILTLDMLDSIKKLLTSDHSNFEIALQMLYPFNPKPYAYTIAKMINSKYSYYGIQYTSFWKSSKFKKYISLIGLERGKFPYDNVTLRHKTFNICGLEDKENIVKEIFEEAYISIKSSFGIIKSYPFLKDAILESPKFIYNEKNYYNTGE